MKNRTARRLAASALATALLVTACGGSADPLGSGATDEGDATVSDPLPTEGADGVDEGEGSTEDAGDPGGGQGIAEGEPNPNTPGEEQAECSAGGMMVTAVQPQGVDEPAATTWNQIRSLALSCDYEGLAQLGDEGQQLAFTFGGETDAAAYWRQQEENGQDPMLKLIQITGTPVAVGDGEGHEGWYIWPAVHADPDDEANWDAIRDIYTPQEIEEMRAAGGYYGYRIAITPEGDWVYFTAGD